MRAVILAGGIGSRLRPYTFSIPKPLVPIGEMPIIEILIRQLAFQGFTRVTISVGHLAALIKAVCADGSQWGVSIDYVEEDEPLGTAGCLSLLDIDDREFVVVNGDTLTDLDFAAAVGAHQLASGVTICTNKREVEVDFGVLDLEDDGLLMAYREKPTLKYTVSMGVYVVSSWVVRDHVPAGRRLDMPDLIRHVMAAGHPVRTHDGQAFWLDLGRIDDLELGDSMFRNERQRFLPT